MPNPRYAKNTKDSANPIFDISDPNLNFLLAASVVDDAPKSYTAAMKVRMLRSGDKLHVRRMRLYSVTACGKLF